MTPVQLIRRKRDGEELTDAEITQFIQGYVVGSIPDYQMSALAMAVYFQGMSDVETLALTQALLDSGRTLSWSDSMVRVDKHSTGGIGDKTSLVLTPMLACCGLQVPMLSGRGLGITGGTLDKLESIPGLRTDLSIEELQQICGEVGCVITGTTAELAPADRKLYALRDVTGTVPAPPLIVASVMSKKLAENLSSLVLDVKCGLGAFMKDLDQARTLARRLVGVGNQLGVSTTALVTDMSQPLGRMVGNALEVVEALETLQGGGPGDLLELSLCLGSELLLMERMANSTEEARQLLLRTIQSGRAQEKFVAMVTAQGGQLASFDLPEPKTISATNSGFLHAIDAAMLGNLLIELGGGRRLITDAIDHGVGFELLVRVGDEIRTGEPLVHVYARSDFDVSKVGQAFTIGEEVVEPLQLIHARVE